jgi:hypothetical protein
MKVLIGNEHNILQSFNQAGWDSERKVYYKVTINYSKML